MLKTNCISCLYFLYFMSYLSDMTFGDRWGLRKVTQKPKRKVAKNQSGHIQPVKPVAWTSIPLIIHAEHKHIVFTRITNYVRSGPAPSSASFPLFRALDCNAPKWLPSVLQRRQSQLVANSGDGSIQKPQNEAFCNVKDWCLRCLWQKEGNAAAWLRPVLCWPITGSLQGPGISHQGVKRGLRWHTWNPWKHDFPWRYGDITWVGCYISNLDIWLRIKTFKIGG